MIGTIKNVVKRTSGAKVYFFGTLTSDLAKVATFVPVIEESESFLNQEKKDGYQRPGTKARMSAFKRYIEENPDRLIPPIILSGRGKWVFSGTSVGELEIREKAAIIDGQHRMGGLAALYEENEEIKEIDFICFENLTREEEINEFTTINGEQKGVPKALNTYLKGEEDALIAWDFGQDTRSPFYGKISRTSMTQDKWYNLHSIAKNVGRTFDHGAFQDELSYDEKLEVLINYWNLIKKHNETEWSDSDLKKKDHRYKLLELTGNIAWSLIAPDILIKGYAASSKSFNWEVIEDKIAFCSSDVDWSKKGAYMGRTGEVGGKAIHKELQKILANDD